VLATVGAPRRRQPPLWVPLGLVSLLAVVLAGPTLAATPGGHAEPSAPGAAAPWSQSTLVPGPAGAAFAWSDEGVLLTLREESFLPAQSLGLDPTFQSLEILWGDGNFLLVEFAGALSFTFLHAYAHSGTYNVTDVLTYTMPTILVIPGQNATATCVSSAYALVTVAPLPFGLA
jgi:hypothetical protein